MYGLGYENPVGVYHVPFRAPEEPRRMTIEEEHSGVSSHSSDHHKHKKIYHENCKYHIITLRFLFFNCEGLNQWLTLSLGTLSDASYGAILPFIENCLVQQPSWIGSNPQLPISSKSTFQVGTIFIFLSSSSSSSHCHCFSPINDPVES